MGFLDDLRDRFQLWRAMRAYRHRDAGNDERGYWECWNLLLTALDVYERGDRARAIELWQRAYTLYPEHAVRSDDSIKLLGRLGLDDEIDALLDDADRRFPGRVATLRHRLHFAMHRHAWDDVVRLAETYRVRQPTALLGFSLGVSALSELGRLEEADALLAGACRMQPDDLGLMIESARLAERRGQWDRALEIWRAYIAAGGNHTGAMGEAGVLRHKGRYDEAEAILVEARRRSGNEVELWMAHAELADARGDWDEAIDRWNGVRRRFPMSPRSYLVGFRGLIETGRAAEIEDVMRAGIERIPDEPSLWIEYAFMAHRRGEWDEAAKRWAAARERFPEAREPLLRGAEALEALGRADEAAALRARLA